MSLPANLFMDAPEMEDVSLHQLGSDVESWPEEIVTKVKERLPQAQSMSVMVQFKKKDDENGVATGSVLVNSADKVVVIPIIIKDFMLYPLDIMIANSKLLPLTTDYFSAVMMKDQVFDKIEEFPTFGGLGRFEDANLWNSIYPPSLGRYAYASAGYPVLEAVADSIDGSEFKAWLKEPANEKTAARLLSGPHKDLVVKLANLQHVNMNEYSQGVENLVPRSIALLRHDGPNKYSLLQNSDTVFHPSITPMTRHQAHAYVSELSDHAADDINDVDMTGEKFLRIPEPLSAVVLAKPDQETPEAAHEFDHYFVKTKSGVGVEGLVIPKVISFDMKPTDLKLFVGKTMSTLQEEIWGVRIKNSRFKLPTSRPKTGQTGVFVFQPDNSHALCTVPVTIRSITEECGGLRLEVSDLLGMPMKLRMAPGFELHAIVPMGPGQYQLPSAMKWVATEGFGEVTNSADDYAVKTAGYALTDWPVTVIPTGSGFFSLKGVDKYAAAAGWDRTMVKAAEVKFLLASLGASEEKIAGYLKEAAFRGKVDIHGLRAVPLLSEKIALARPLAVAMVKKAKEFQANLTKAASLVSGLSDREYTLLDGAKKIASHLENGQTVDALLSLNFVSPMNVMKYVAKLPSLKAAVSHLAACLLASRLGMTEIPEQSTSAAMMRLVEVVDGLERLRATQEVTGQQMGTA